MGFETQDVERKGLSILKVLRDSPEALGARVIARRLKDFGIELGERAVRYHLKLMDERGLTELVGRDGRLLTELGVEELESAMVRDKVGFAHSRIELLSFRTAFDWHEHAGLVPVNISLFDKKDFAKAVKVMKPVFSAGFCVSHLVAVAQEGETIGELTVPEGKTALATVCGIVINGSLLKAGVPIDSRFGGILQIRWHSPRRFVELIDYAGSYLDPSEVFIGAKMTSVMEAAENGGGKILAGFRELPAASRPMVEEVLGHLKDAGLGGVMVMGGASETVCEIPVELNRIGMVVLGGLNPVAAAVEAGCEVENHAMSTVMEYQQLNNIEEL